MANGVSDKTERLEARIAPGQKMLLKKAAGLQGQSLTDFVVKNALDAAKKIIREHEIIELSTLDRKVFVDALLNPPAPSRNARQAAKRYLAVESA
ncbi:MAG: DUF1778 domain-containing protein [Bryobacterales bacterium]